MWPFSSGTRDHIITFISFDLHFLEPKIKTGTDGELLFRFTVQLSTSCMNTSLI